jgi:hypothetical protein
MKKCPPLYTLANSNRSAPPSVSRARNCNPFSFRIRGPTGRCRFDSTKRTELHFHALLTEGDTQVRFHREGFGRLKNNLE